MSTSFTYIPLKSCSFVPWSPCFPKWYHIWTRFYHDPSKSGLEYSAVLLLCNFVAFAWLISPGLYDYLWSISDILQVVQDLLSYMYRSRWCFLTRRVAGHMTWLATLVDLKKINTFYSNSSNILCGYLKGRMHARSWVYVSVTLVD